MALPAEYAARAAPPGTPRAWALLFAPAARRDALTALYALDAELADATRPGVEHGVAHAKLAWWRGEVDRLAAGRPQHPLGRALRAAGEAPDYALLHERLVAADLRLAGFAPGTSAELGAVLGRSHGVVQQLAAQLLGGARSPALERFGAALGEGEGLASIVLRAHADARVGELRVPLDLLADAGLAPEALHEAEPPPALREVLARLAARAVAALDRARTELVPGDARVQAHGVVLAALLERRLAHALAPRGAAGAPRTGGDATLAAGRAAAFADLWTAWRAARRATRGAAATPRERT